MLLLLSRMKKEIQLLARRLLMFYVPSDWMAGLYLKFGFGQGYTIKYIYIITHDCLFGPSLCGCSDRPAQSHMDGSPRTGFVRVQTLGAPVIHWDLL